MKKFVTDTNAVAQEKALDAVLAFVENAGVAPRFVIVYDVAGCDAYTGFEISGRPLAICE